VSSYLHSDTKCNCPRVASSLIKLDLATENEIDNLITPEYRDLYDHMNPGRSIRGCVWCKLKCAIARRLTANLWDV
jgi:hypothetical protein